MKYDPIKRTLGNVFNQTPTLRIFFYRLLDLLLLRSWHIRRALSQWNTERGNRPATFLDAGSGFGQYTYYLATLNKGNHVKGVDVKTEQIADCNKFFEQIGMSKRITFAEADLTQFSEPDTYDLVLSVDVMEHILEDEKVFQNFYTSLRNGGMLLISTPSDKGGSDADEHDHEDGVHGFIDEHVRDGYNIDDIRQKLTRAGFRDIDATYSYGKPGHISWVLSMKWPILMLGASKLFFIVLPFYYLLTFPLCLILNTLDLFGKHTVGTGLIVKAHK